MRNKQPENINSRIGNDFEDVTGKDQVWNGERFVTSCDFSIGMDNTIEHGYRYRGQNIKKIFEIQNDIIDEVPIDWVRWLKKQEGDTADTKRGWLLNAEMLKNFKINNDITLKGDTK